MKTFLQNSKIEPTLFFLMLLFLTTESFAQVSTLRNWSSLYNNTSSATQTVAYTVPTGSNSNRVLAVAIASSQTAIGARTVTITYGGQTMTLAAGNMGTTTTRQHTAIYYLNESGLDLVANANVVFTVNGGTTRVTTVWAAVFDYVDQTTPITNSQNFNSNATLADPFVFGTALTINTNDLAVLAISSLRPGNTGSRNITAPTNFTNVNQQRYQVTDGVRNAIANRTVPTSNTSSVCSTDIQGNTLTQGSMTGVSFKGCGTPPTAIAGTALTSICQGGISAGLAGSVGGSATGGTWSSNVAGGTFTPNATSLNATWTPPSGYFGTAILTLTSSGGACGTATASKSLVVRPRPTAVTATASAIGICAGGTVNLTASATSNSPTVPLLNQNFNSTPVGWTRTNTSTGGTPADAAWKLRPNGYNYTGTIFNSNDTSRFYLSNSDDQGTGGTTATTLQTPAFSTAGLSDASLTFYHFYRYNATESATVEISTNGTSWTVLNTYTSNQGTATGFVQVTTSLAAYLGQATVYIRFKYVANFDKFWAIDNVAVTGTVIPTSYAWTATPLGYTSATQNPTGVAPTVNTIYTVEVTNAFGCKAAASTESVVVNAVPTSGILTPTPATGMVCAGTSVSATATAGSGGAGTVDDELEVSLSGGAYTAYSSGTSISTTGQTSISIRTRRTATGNGCTSSSYNTATWTSSVKTYTAGAWSPSAPTVSDAAVISSNYNVAGDIAACSLTINSSAVVTIPSGSDVVLAGPLTVSSGSFTLENSANLIQTTNATNTGNITVKRDTNPLIRLDYTLWSSPVAGQGLYAFSPFTFASRFYQYLTATDIYSNSVGFAITGLDGNGVNGTDSNNVPFAVAKGYLVRTPWNHPTAPAVWTGQFSGVPNNGAINYTLETTGTRFNAIGNPYPSPINITQFATDNSSNIESTLYFWRKTNNSASVSYCTWNTATSTFGDNGEAYTESPLGIIQTGQGFLVEAKSGATTVAFNNDQRIGDNANQFFRTSSSSTSLEANRIWLNMTGATSGFSQAVVGYFTNATLGADDTDSKHFNDGSIAFTSTIDNQDYVIQGRPVPFDATDVVPMKYKVTTAGSYTITIDHVDGIFSGGQTIYLRDNLTAVVHDLTAGNYTFTSEAGTFASRFELVYQGALGVTSPTFNTNQVILYKNEANDLVINSGTIIMASVKVFDIKGRLLLERKEINAAQTTITLGMSNEVLLVQITAVDGVVVTKKVMH